MKTLLAHDFPVIIEKGLVLDEEGWLGHYLFLIGYNNSASIFYTYDSYLGNNDFQGREEDYDYIDDLWRQFNRPFIVLYPADREAEVYALLGEYASETQAAQLALEEARRQAAVNPDDNWAWFGVGQSLTMLGDYESATLAFDQAFLLGMPWRTLWYMHSPYIAYFRIGRYDDILAHTQGVDSTTSYVEETFYYRGLALAAQGNVQEAIQAFDNALRNNSNFEAARLARDAVQNGTFSSDVIFGE